MRFDPDRPPLQKAQKSEDGNQLSSAGKTMSPPGFQLDASAAQSPLQAKFGDGAGGESAPVVQRQFYGPENAEMCYANPAGADPVWDDFATRFNEEFKSILHVFAPKGHADCASTEPESSQSQPEKLVGKGEQSGAVLTGAELKALLTEGQREKLSAFMTDKIIPERLFNGDDVGASTAQQRLLMAAHILVVGKYAPGSFEQSVHARMCWHWVHITHHYAGATPAGGLNQGMMGVSDHSNNVVLGSGKNQSIFHGKGVKPKDLPKEYDESKHLGPIPADTGHDIAAKAEQAKLEQDPTAKTSTKMLETMPYADFGKIQPGDWLWYYNANGSGVGSHSVIFSRWSTSEKVSDTGVRYRTAICFSQGMPEWGGREHTANLGERYYKDSSLQISPINYCTRVSEDANPADTVDKLLPKGADKKEKALQGDNEKYIARAEKKYKKPVDRVKLAAILQAENAKMIQGLDARLTDGQKALLAEANASAEFETLVRLNQRLTAILTNTDITAANMESTYAKKDTEYDAAKAKYDEADAKITAEVLRLDAQKAELEKKLLDKSTTRDEKDTAPEVKTNKREFDQLDREIKGIEKKHKRSNPEFLTTDKDFLAKKKKRDDLAETIKTLKSTGIANRKDLEKLRTEIASIKKTLSGNAYRHKVEDKKRAEAVKELPFCTVHPGSWKGQMKGGTTGKLADVLPIARFADALGEGELAQPAPKAKAKKPKK